MARIMVTGGAGFIGSHVTDLLLAQGHQVSVVDDLSSGSLDNLDQAWDLGRGASADRFQFIELDITHPDASDTVQWFQPDVIVHLAAQIDVRASVQDPVRDAAVNVLGTIQLLEGARAAGTQKFVFITSGGCIYGEPDPSALPVSEASPINPLSPYGASKHAAEVYLHMYEVLHGLAWTSLALANVYGPRQRPDGEAGVVAIFGSRMLADQPVTIYGDGEQSRDFVHVADVTEAVVRAVDRPGCGRVNIGTAERTSVNQLFRHMAALTGYSHEAHYQPARSGEVLHSALDVARAAAELDWQPRIGLAEGLADTVAWLRAQAGQPAASPAAPAGSSTPEHIS